MNAEVGHRRKPSQKGDQCQVLLLLLLVLRYCCCCWCCGRWYCAPAVVAAAGAAGTALLLLLLVLVLCYYREQCGGTAAAQWDRVDIYDKLFYAGEEFGSIASEGKNAWFSANFHWDPDPTNRKLNRLEPELTRRASLLLSSLPRTPVRRRCGTAACVTTCAIRSLGGRTTSLWCAGSTLQSRSCSPDWPRSRQSSGPTPSGLSRASNQRRPGRTSRWLRCGRLSTTTPSSV